MSGFKEPQPSEDPEGDQEMMYKTPLIDFLTNEVASEFLDSKGFDKTGVSGIASKALDDLALGKYENAGFYVQSRLEGMQDTLRGAQSDHEKDLLQKEINELLYLQHCLEKLSEISKK